MIDIVAKPKKDVKGLYGILAVLDSKMPYSLNQVRQLNPFKVSNISETYDVVDGGWSYPTAMMHRMNLPLRPSKLPNLFMTGQWGSAGGGIRPCIMSSEKVVELIDKCLR